MQNYQVYLNQAKEITLQVYHYQLFQELVITFTILAFFIWGRISHEKRLTHLLDMINDVEKTRKNLTQKLQKQNKTLSSLYSKKKVLWILFGIVIILNAAIYYITQSIVVIYIIYSIAPFILTSLLYFIIQKWAKWTHKITQKRLKNTSTTAQAQIKQILRIFGTGLKQKLKNLYDQQIDVQWFKQSKLQCKLYKCYTDKKSYEQLYKLYEQVINQIKKANMCDVCLSENNISVQKLGLAQLQNTLRNFKRAKAGKLALPQKKQMVNRLLAEYQKICEKLPFICKKGCCIKQRLIIENVKAIYYDKLKRLASQLSSQKK